MKGMPLFASYPWIVPDKNGGLQCLICKGAGVMSPWVEGKACKSRVKSEVEQHNSKGKHLVAMETVEFMPAYCHLLPSSFLNPWLVVRDVGAQCNVCTKAYQVGPWLPDQLSWIWGVAPKESIALDAHATGSIHMAALPPIQLPPISAPEGVVDHFSNEL